MAGGAADAVIGLPAVDEALFPNVAPYRLPGWYAEQDRSGWLCG
jgi:hypothetical protein